MGCRNPANPFPPAYEGIFDIDSGVKKYILASILARKVARK